MHSSEAWNDNEFQMWLQTGCQSIDSCLHVASTVDKCSSTHRQTHLPLVSWFLHLPVRGTRQNLAATPRSAPANHNGLHTSHFWWTVVSFTGEMVQCSQIHMYTTAAVQKCPTNQALKNVANIYSKSICTSHTITVQCISYIQSIVLWLMLCTSYYMHLLWLHYVF